MPSHREDDARARFQRLANDGAVPGRLYALCGLLLIGPDEGANFARSLSLTPGNVTIREGDYWFDTPAARAIVLVFSDNVPERLRAARGVADAFFRETLDERGRNHRTFVR